MGFTQQIPRHRAERHGHGRIHRPAPIGARIGAHDEQAGEHAGRGHAIGDAQARPVARSSAPADDLEGRAAALVAALHRAAVEQACRARRPARRCRRIGAPRPAPARSPEPRKRATVQRERGADAGAGTGRRSRAARPHVVSRPARVVSLAPSAASSSRASSSVRLKYTSSSSPLQPPCSRHSCSCRSGGHAGHEIRELLLEPGVELQRRRRAIVRIGARLEPLGPQAVDHQRPLAAPRGIRSCAGAHRRRRPDAR